MPRQQLISYIAPGAPATRRLAEGNEPFLRPEVGFTPQWYREALGIDFGQRWHSDVRYRRETILAMRHELRRRFPGAHIGGADGPDAPLDLLTGVFGTCMVAAIFGRPIVYTANNWPNVKHQYLTRAQMAALEVPDLATNRVFKDLLRQVDEIERIQGQAVGFINWQGVLNNAQRLRGPHLFVDLYEVPQLVYHIFGVICETMLRGVRRLYERQRATGVDCRFATISNCLVNLISPLQYAEFVLPYDRRIASEFDEIGIHNCAWNADPYLALYATIPSLAYIDMGINSNLEKARTLIPHARRALMYTPMDLADKSMDAIHEDLKRAARDYAPCDIVLADIESGTPDERVLGVIDCCHELSK
ncbi:MAG: uroporphyrinogen decarboxylase family protein [Planctomycetota bacterium]|jgi:hypothetical protein